MINYTPNLKRLNPEIQLTAHAPLPLSTRNEPFLTYAQFSFLITVRIFRMAGALPSDLIGHFDDHRFAIGLITAVYQFAVAGTVGARAFDGTAIERFALFVIVAAQIEQFCVNGKGRTELNS